MKAKAHFREELARIKRALDQALIRRNPKLLLSDLNEAATTLDRLREAVRKALTLDEPAPKPILPQSIQEIFEKDSDTDLIHKVRTNQAPLHPLFTRMANSDWDYTNKSKLYPPVRMKEFVYTILAMPKTTRLRDLPQASHKMQGVAKFAIEGWESWRTKLNDPLDDLFHETNSP
jgi:hypothetical protein